MKWVRHGIEKGILCLLAACSSPRDRDNPQASLQAGLQQLPSDDDPDEKRPQPPTIPSRASDELSNGIHWTSCVPPNAIAQCGVLTVPLDHSNPSSGNIALSVVRYPARGARRGVLFVDPGGVGASAVSYLADVYPRKWINGPLAPLANAFDIVAFDRRGVGGSRPAIDCFGTDMTAFFALNPERSSPSNEQDRRAYRDSLRAGCANRSGEFLRYISTERVAHDLDVFRQALHEDRISMLTYSYGTVLAAMYAEHYPAHIRAAILDSPFDPSLDGVTVISHQARNTAVALNELRAHCLANPPPPVDAGIPGWDPMAGLNCINHYISNTRKISVQNYPNFDRLTRSMAYLGVLNSLQYSYWVPLCEKYTRAIGQPNLVTKTFFREYQSRRFNSLENFSQAHTAIMHADGLLPKMVEDYDAILDANPATGHLVVGEVLMSAFWPHPPERTPAPISAPDAPPLLIVASHGDRFTPFAWAESLHAQLTSSVLHVHRASGHTSVGSTHGVDRSTNDAAVNYLLNAD